MSATRVCTKCLTEKPMDDFPWKNRALNRRHAVCKPCMASRSNGWYKNNKSSHIQNVMAHKKIDKQEARQFVRDYLTEHPCTICGEADPVVLEFDHVNEKKETVSALIANGATVERLKQEINRCQVLCSNCHARKTAKERGWFRSRI